MFRVSRVEKTVVYSFDSFVEAVERAEKIGHVNEWDNSEWLGRGFTTWDHLLECCHGSNQEVMRSVEEMIEAVDEDNLPQPQDIRRRRKFDEMEGDDIDLDRLRGGQPFWNTTTRKRASGSESKTIAVNLGASVGVSADKVYWRGVCAIALSHILEKAGYNVELWGVLNTLDLWENTYGKDRNLFMGCRMKDFGQPLDLGTVCTIISTWVFRSVWFSNFSHEDKEEYPLTSGLGHPGGINEPELLVELIGVYNEEDTVLIDKVWDQENSTKLLLKILGQYLGEIEEISPELAGGGIDTSTAAQIEKLMEKIKDSESGIVQVDMEMVLPLSLVLPSGVLTDEELVKLIEEAKDKDKTGSPCLVVVKSTSWWWSQRLRWLSSPKGREQYPVAPSLTP